MAICRKIKSFKFIRFSFHGYFNEFNQKINHIFRPFFLDLITRKVEESLPSLYPKVYIKSYEKIK